MGRQGQLYAEGKGGGRIEGTGAYKNQPQAPQFTALPNIPPPLPPNTPRTETIKWAVIRITNIPWEVSLQDMQQFFSGLPFPPEHLLAQNVHILMDRTTGKTFHSAFVELSLTRHQAGIVAEARNLKVLKGRVVTVELSSQDELMRSVFPKWTGEFLDGEPVVLERTTAHSRSNPIGDRALVKGENDSGATGRLGSQGLNGDQGRGGSQSSASTPCFTAAFVARDEINALLTICRNYKLHYSRKCAERPFENILTILVKYPWHQAHRMLPLHRDHIFELLKLSLESLRTHQSKEYNNIHPTLLTRMIRAAILIPAFTERQKTMVLHVAGCPCPEDIVGWMTPPVPVESRNSESDKEGDVKGDGCGENRQSSSLGYIISHPLDPTERAVESLVVTENFKDNVQGSPIDALLASTKNSRSSTPPLKEHRWSTQASWPVVTTPVTTATTLTSSATASNAVVRHNESPNSPSETVFDTLSLDPTDSSGGRHTLLMPSYAAAVTQRAATSPPLGEPLDSTSGTNDSQILPYLPDSKSVSRQCSGVLHRHSGRSLSLCSSSSLALSDTMTQAAEGDSLDDHSRPESLTKDPNKEQTGLKCVTTVEFRSDNSTTSVLSPAQAKAPLPCRNFLTAAMQLSAESLTSTLPGCGAASLPNNPMLSSSPVLSPKLPSTSVPTSGAERSKSETIVDAIKTITQSTPRLPKPCLLSSAVGESQVAGLPCHSCRQHRREVGETL
ncbi:hypothetical protein BGZ99_008809 [Dissophora globulifera]|uniref:RRM domain-containing protein n=1 Tax=Dissophora globulifera TaxID=979702 RepID=A0A9P6RTR4_9FUNG|nr:hypothetical protein BGZ99_008809 [Dissophora globulifera]